MGYQFIHINVYSRTASKVSPKKKTMRDILAEANREPGNIYHVLKPTPPNVLLGSIQDVEKSANEWAENSKDSRGHKLRKDALCLLAGVISLPREQGEDWEKFRGESVEWLKSKYGERLKAVVEHTDETHPHIHFYAVPNAGEKFDDIHDGKRASAQSKAAGEVKGKQNRAYIEAMRLFQDNFGAKVASKYGLARLGPKKRRLSYAEWKAEQAQAKSLKNVKANARNYVREARKYGLKKGLKKVAETWAGFSFADKFKFSMLHVPTKKAMEKAKEAEAMGAEAKKEADRLREEKDKAEAKAEEYLKGGVEHARASRLAIEKAKDYKAKAQELAAENEALRAEVADLKAPKSSYTPKKKGRQGYAV